MKEKIGVLALQGDFAEHILSMQDCGADAFQVRSSSELDNLDGLIIPGGESTAIAKLTGNNSDPIFATIKEKIGAGMPVWGTCMGSIFLAKDIEGSSQGRLASMDIGVRRNVFGPQSNSFELLVDIPCLGSAEFLAVFIRAPIIVSCAQEVEVLASIEEGIIMARQGRLLATAFHPELVADRRVHQYFLAMVRHSSGPSAGVGKDLAKPSDNKTSLVGKSQGQIIANHC